MWTLAAVAGLGVLNAVGQVMMRLAGRDLETRKLVDLIGRPAWVFGLVLCWCCGLAWAVLVTRVPMGVGVPLFIGTFFSMIALLSHYWLGEPLALKQGIGFLLVFGGILLIARQS